MTKTSGIGAASVAWLLLGGVVLGETPTPAGANGFTVELLHVAAVRPLPADLSDRSRPMGLGEPGLELTLMVRGAHLAGVDWESLKLDVLRTKSGRDLRTVDGRSVCRLEPDGGYRHSHRFVRVICSAPTEELDGLEVAGSLTVVAADGTETLKTEKLDLTKKSKEKVRLDDFEIGLEGESKPGLMHAIGTAFGEAPDREFIHFSLRGKLNEIADIDVVVGDKKLLWREKESFGDRASYAYLKDGDGQGTIEIQRWKNLHDVVVQFQARVPGGGATQSPPRAYTVGEYSTELVKIAATRAVPADVPEIARPNSCRDPGFTLTYLLRGPNITEVRPFGHTVELLRTKDGRDIRLRDGQENYDVHRVHNFDENPKYHFFEVTSKEPLFGALDGLEALGLAGVVVGQGRTTLTSEPIDFSKPGTVMLGEWKIAYRVDEGTRTIAHALPLKDDGTPDRSREKPPTIEDYAELNLSPEGADDDQRIINLEVLVDGKPVRSLGWAMGASAPAMSVRSSTPIVVLPPGATLPPVGTSTTTVTLQPVGTVPPTATIQPTGTFQPPGTFQPSAASTTVQTLTPAATPTVPTATAPSAALVPTPDAISSSPTLPSPTLPSGVATAPSFAVPAQIMGQPRAASSFRFEKPTGRGVVRITYWKERYEFRVPFSYNLQADAK